MLADRSLDFCVVTSSLSSYLGGFGFAAYTAANVFMDAFAHEQNGSGDVPWIAINWDGWLRKEAVSEFGGTHALAMTPDEGVQSFARVLARPELHHVIVSTGDLQSRVAQWTHILAPSGDRTESGSVEAERHARPDVSSTFKAPQTEAEVAIAAIWQELLGIDRIGADDNFFELGGDSLLATRVAPRIRDAFQVDIQLREIFEDSTITALAERVERILIEQIYAMSNEEVERKIGASSATRETEHE